MLRWLIPIVAVCISAGCQETNSTVGTQPQAVKNEQKATHMTQEVTIKIGELGSEFQKRYPDQVKINKQPAGLDFYSIDWKFAAQGVVKVSHGAHSFEIDNVLSVLTSIDIDTPQEGFRKFSINAGITSPDLIPHQEARDKLYAILKAIEQKGWRNLISEDDPRITGKDRLNHVLSVTNSIGLDTKYVPTLDEWMRIENLTPWNFYAEHQYLTVYFKRERILLDPTKPGSYLLTYTLKSEVENYRGYVGTDNRRDWKQKLPAALDDLKQRRAKAEAALKAKDIKIDEAYQDPPLPNLK
jgi:hypothetical protein